MDSGPALWAAVCGSFWDPAALLGPLPSERERRPPDGRQMRGATGLKNAYFARARHEKREECRAATPRQSPFGRVWINAAVRPSIFRALHFLNWLDNSGTGARLAGGRKDAVSQPLRSAEFWRFFSVSRGAASFWSLRPSLWSAGVSSPGGDLLPGAISKHRASPLGNLLIKDSQPTVQTIC